MNVHISLNINIKTNFNLSVINTLYRSCMLYYAKFESYHVCVCFYSGHSCFIKSRKFVMKSCLYISVTKLKWYTYNFFFFF